jgi:hypothetical protein
MLAGVTKCPLVTATAYGGTKECPVAELSLRTVGGTPSPQAHHLGLVKQAATGRGNQPGYFYLWKTDSVVELLEAAGHRQVLNPERKPAMPNVLVGPFSNRTSSADGYDIINGNGSVFGWMRGEKAANWVVRLLNLADQHGKFA